MNPKTSRFVLSAWILGFCLMVSLPLHAQVAGATLSGTVMDQSGGVVPQVAITVKNIATGITRNSTTSAAGFYSAPNLLPGTYEIRAAAQGFSSQVQTGIKLTVGEQQILNFTLQVGQMTQTVEVTTEAPNVELASSAISAVVGATTVVELPLNGRSWTDLATLQPGVNALSILQPTFEVGTDRGNRGFGAQLSISGGRPQENNYRLDGVSINDYGNGGPGSVLGGNLGVDSIQEFSVLTSNYSAEYGKTSGGVVNAITRSGTNQFHGSVYEFLRNDALDAANFFEDPTVPPFKRNQFGASAGAPIRKDKTFIFGDYESIRQSLGTTTPTKVLSLPARSGILNFPKDPFPPNCTPTSVANQCQVTVDSSVKAFLALEPPPSGPVIGDGNTAQYNFAPIQVVNENFFTIRADQNISDKDKLFGTYSFDNAPSTRPDAFFGNVLLAQSDRRQIAAVEETHTFSASFVNSVRLGYNRSHTQAAGGIKAINPAAADPSLSWAPGFTFAPRVLTFAGLSQIGPGVSAPQFLYFWNAYQIYDDAFVTKGAHSLKFGGTFENDQMNATTRTADFVGTYSFKSISDFLTNQPSRVRGALP